MHRTFCPRERHSAPFLQEAGWVPGTVWTVGENHAPTGIRSPDRPTCIDSLSRMLYVSVTMKKLFVVFSIKVAAYLQLHTIISGYTTHFVSQFFKVQIFKGKGIPLQVSAGYQSFRRLRLSELLNNRHMEGDKVVSTTHRSPLTPTPPGDTGDSSGTYFCQSLSRPSTR